MNFRIETYLFSFVPHQLPQTKKEFPQVYYEMCTLQMGDSTSVEIHILVENRS